MDCNTTTSPAISDFFGIYRCGCFGSNHSRKALVFAFSLGNFLVRCSLTFESPFNVFGISILGVVAPSTIIIIISIIVIITIVV